MPAAKKPAVKKQEKSQAEETPTLVMVQETPKKAQPAATLPTLADMKAFNAQKGKRPAINAAQDCIYDAWEETAPKKRLALAYKALSICPLCADAYVLIGNQEKNKEKALGIFLLGVKAGEIELGKKGFDSYAPHFWGFHETRPYMRARAAVAITLLELGDTAAATGHIEAMLVLNPGDNQGLRYILLGIFVRQDDDAAAKKLVAAFKDEGSTFWCYTRALLAFKAGKAAQKPTIKIVGDALNTNKHVPAILSGSQKPVEAAYYRTRGGADEASDYVRDFGEAWHRVPGAVDWLLAHGTAPIKQPKNG
jgi:hypothetical protein